MSFEKVDAWADKKLGNKTKTALAIVIAVAISSVGTIAAGLLG